MLMTHTDITHTLSMSHGHLWEEVREAYPNPLSSPGQEFPSSHVLSKTPFPYVPLPFSYCHSPFSYCHSPFSYVPLPFSYAPLPFSNVPLPLFLLPLPFSFCLLLSTLSRMYICREAVFLVLAMEQEPHTCWTSALPLSHIPNMLCLFELGFHVDQDGLEHRILLLPPPKR